MASGCCFRATSRRSCWRQGRAARSRSCCSRRAWASSIARAIRSIWWGALFSYWPWLVKEIIKSGWDVTRRILHLQLPISPTLVRFRPTQKTDLGLVIHAQSITLTPGTISVEVGHGEFLVHAVSAEAGGSLSGSEMDRRVTELERGR
ncbi:MAG: Na+/H+ antiporter subunit E [Betaproteobacteria bacterium]|nr:Na+/H+ antiporter subunit E [Betaproteobacteria bacterium]